MNDHIGLIHRPLVSMVAAAIALFAADSAGLRAEVLGQSGGATTIELGELQEPKRLPPEEIRDRGIKLRAELDKALDRLLDKTAGDVTAVVLPYIPSGLAVEDAVNILRAAGFTDPSSSGASEEQDRNGQRDRYAVVAEIPQFSRRVFGPVEAHVMLRPESLAASAGRRRRMIYYLP